MGLFDWLKVSEKPPVQEVVRHEEVFVPVDFAALPQTKYVISEDSYLRDSLGTRLYHVSKQNQPTATEDAMQMNIYIQEASRIIHKTLAPLERVHFIQTDGVSSTMLCVGHLTKTEKLPKYPFSLHFADGRDSFSTRAAWTSVFGGIFYLPNGQLGKARIVNWVKGKCYTIDLVLEANDLVVQRVESVNKYGEKTRLYDRNK